jgi:hypothetical protein
VLTTDFDLAEAAEILGVEPPEPLPPLSPEREAVVQIVRNGIFAVAGVGIAIALWRMLG